MQPVLDLDTSQFDRAMGLYVQSTNRDLAEIVNQRALNVAGRAFDLIPPSSGGAIEAKRRKIKSYLDTLISSRLKRLTSGKRKGQFGKKGKRENQLQRRHLIVQARRRKAGLKGLYGQAMRDAAAKLSRTSQVSVGFLKSIFLPIITTLNGIARFKFPFWKTSNISRWPGSAGHGQVSIAVPGTNPIALLRATANTTGWNDAGARKILQDAMQGAIDAEAAEMVRHVAEKMQKTANRFNAKAA
jgi:hypothetical protein